MPAPGAPTIQVTGGNLYVNGQIRRTVANLDGALRFDQSGGTVDIDGLGRFGPPEQRARPVGGAGQGEHLPHERPAP
ncbi:MAG: hypothetical protein WKG07_10950 [Hymenobacter sp.]